MEASPSDLSVSSIVLQSPERFFDRRLSVRVHIAGNKKVQLSAPVSYTHLKLPTN